MGTQDDAAFSQPLTAMLRDPDPWVRRHACEAIAHRGVDQPVDDLVRLLGDSDRFVAFAARRALEKTPADKWQDRVLTATTARAFLQGGAGLLGRCAVEGSRACDRRRLRDDAPRQHRPDRPEPEPGPNR